MLVEVGVGLGPARRLGFFEQCEERCPKRWTLSTFRHHVPELGLGISVTESGHPS